jgi:hypothetical protein
MSIQAITLFTKVMSTNNTLVTTKLNKADAQKKVYELTEKLIFVKKDFKDVAAGYKERIKEIESEIKAVVEDATPAP